MSSGIAFARPAVALRRGQLVTIGLLLALAAVAWWVTDLRMAGMDAGPGTDPGAFGFYISTWVVMMAAMMFPSIAPMVLVHRRMARGSGTIPFVAGYLVVWALSGLLGYAVLKAGRSVDGGFFAWDHAGRFTAAGVIAFAALYELTPLKRACLTRCRSPIAFLMGSWRRGRFGAFLMGTEHGGWCLGCCWALMAALFALGAMSLTWMLVITALIAIEKLLPWRVAGTATVAALMAALAIGVATVPASVPALRVPGGGGMSGMSGGSGMSGSSGMSGMSGGSGMSGSGSAMR
jgi:predicted metal-binding membrane protein